MHNMSKPKLKRKLFIFNFLNKLDFKYFFLAIVLLFNNAYCYSQQEYLDNKPRLNNKSILNKNYRYLIGPGDVLNILIYDAKEFSGNFEVLSDGTITLPIAGSIDINGLTITQAKIALEKALSKELIRPDLQIKISDARPIRVSILGEVQTPGVYTLSRRETSKVEGSAVKFDGNPTVMDAIQKAGGITQDADLNNINLLRRNPGKIISHENQKLNLINLIFDGDLSQNPFLFDGDILKINKAKSIDKDLIEIAAVNLSPKTITVNVVGEVNRPGKIKINANTPLSQAIMSAGGPKNWRANTAAVDLIRINRNGSATLKRYRIDLKKGISSKSNPALKNGDSIYVRRNKVAISSDVISGISNPLSGIVTVWSLFRLAE